MVSFDPDLLDILESSPAHTFVGIFDPDDRCTRFGVLHLGDDQAWGLVRSQYSDLKVVLAVDPTATRARLSDHYGIANLLTLVAADAVVSPRATVGPGCVVQRGARILPHARLGRACKLNVDAVAHHDVEVGDFCTLAPGSRLLGSVKLGARVYVGAGALVLPGRVIGDDAVIGAGAVVTKDVPASTTVQGIPARAT